jgi:hypothetical protein
LDLATVRQIKAEAVAEAVEHMDKKLKERDTPRKGNAVFLLLYKNEPVGTCFAIDSTYMLSARHNIYEDNVPFVPGDVAYILDCNGSDASTAEASSAGSSSSSSTGKITVENERIPVAVVDAVNPVGDQPVPDNEDWIILRRTDSKEFSTFITPLFTPPGFICRDNNPRVTIYHHPISFRKAVNLIHTLSKSENRIMRSQNGELHCNALNDLSKGSCGAPYVDIGLHHALGLHIAGVSSMLSTVKNKAIVEASSLIPVGLHFVPDGCLQQALRSRRIMSLSSN